MIVTLLVDLLAALVPVGPTPLAPAATHRALGRSAAIRVPPTSDGLAAVAAIEDGDLDVVLLDYQMPHMDGLEVAQRVRAMPDRRDLCLIAMTANVRPEDRKLCLDAGMNDFLGKPLQLEVLRKTLVGCLQPT